MIINVDIESSGTGVDALQAGFEFLDSHAVYVGVPEEKAQREGDMINNASLVYIHTHGSPVNKLPARPIIEPAIEDKHNREKIEQVIRLMTKAVMEGDMSKARRMLELLGMDAVNIVKDWFTNPRNNWAPNKDETVRRKLRKKGISSDLITKLVEDYKAGVPDINTVLVDTAVMRNAITYVVEGL